jgi:NAD(P)H dehydrogenase (quinone)
MSRVMILLAHPVRGSFNHAIAETAAAALEDGGHEVFYHDLYEEGFDPVLPGTEIPRDAGLPEDIGRHCRELEQSDGIVVVHPNWWGQPPAILKGWVDRVVRPGVAYEFLEGDSGEGVPAGLLRGRKAVIFNTANTPERREREVFSDPLELLWRTCIFGLCGVEDVYRRMFTVVVTSSVDERRAWLEEVAATVAGRFPPT